MTTVKNRFFAWHLGVPLLIGLMIFAVFDLTTLDDAISDWLYLPDGRFPFAHDRLFENLTHRWPRILPNWTGEAALIGAGLSFIWPLLRPERHGGLIRRLQALGLSRPLQFAARHRRDWLFIVVAFALSTGAIHFFKSHTGIYCPVETTPYGGTHEKKAWFEQFTLLQAAGAGRCWPGGHASGGFSLLALYFVARRYQWRYTKATLYAALTVGMIFGTTRVIQGWHFMSHTLWAGVIVWLCTLFTALAFYGWRPLPISRRAIREEIN